MKKTEMNETSNQEMVTISRVEYEAQQGRIAKLEQQVSVLTEALHLSRHKQFGASSEKSEDTLMEQLSFLFNEAEVFSAPEEENVVVVPEHKAPQKARIHSGQHPRGYSHRSGGILWRVQIWYALSVAIP